MDRSVSTGRRLDVSSEQGELFFDLILQYFAIASAFLFLVVGFSKAVQIKKGDDSKEHLGLFASAKWHIAVRGPTSMLLFAIILIPVVLLLVCFILGSALAAVEGWPVILGIEYLIFNVLHLADPLSSVSPTTTSGSLVDVLVSIVAMLIVATALGVAANMSLVITLSSMYGTTAGFCQYLFVVIPMCLVALSAATGALMALIEDWSFFDGFYFMVGQICGLANPLTTVAPQTAQGCFLETVCVIIDLVLGAAVVGIVCAHPLTQVLIQCIEGKAVEEAAAQNGTKVEEPCPLDDIIEGTSDPDLRKRLLLKEAEFQRGLEAVQRQLRKLQDTGDMNTSIETAKV